MPDVSAEVGDTRFLPKDRLGRLIELLQEQGYSVIGPTEIDGTVMLRPLKSVEDLPRGVNDEQDGGSYKLIEGDEDLHFEYVVGPDSAKRYLFPPEQRTFKMHVSNGRFVLDAGPPQPKKLALLGVRPCDLAALAVQDRVFGVDEESFRCESDTYYLEGRRQVLLIAVNCTDPASTCFCASMGTGPQARENFDLALTELRAGFVVEVGSERGAELAKQLSLREPSSTEMELAELKLTQAAEHMGRELDNDGIVELLDKAVEHPHWDEVAKRCLSCGNCTMVCPTCFCSTVVDSTDITGKSVTRTREWESCYTHQFSYTTGGPHRNSIRGRYRHWLRHKLCTWWDQFNCSGCVGCGRCITWCPVGIDLTEEVEAIRGQGVRQMQPRPTEIESEVIL